MEITKLLTFNYQKCSSQYEIDNYIRVLRKNLLDLKLQNDFLLKEESYIPIKVHREYYFDEEEMFETDLKDKDADYKAITITFDQKKFPQLIITPLSEQIKYIEKVISNLLYEQHITAIYGSFERQKNGYIHGHFIVPYYGNHHNLQTHINTYFTDRTKGDKQYAVLIKPVDNLSVWFKYMNKKETFKKFLEYNLKINSLNI